MEKNHERNPSEFGKFDAKTARRIKAKKWIENRLLNKTLLIWFERELKTVLENVIQLFNFI